MKKKNMTFHKKKYGWYSLLYVLMMTGLIGRLVYLMCFRSDYYYKKAKELHERERERSKRPEERFWMQKKFWHQKDGMYNLCDPQSD